MSSAPSPDHASLSILLLQARKGQDMELQEQDCFLERCHLERSQLHSLNLARTDSLPDVTELFNGYDAFFIGGAGEYSAVEEYDWMPFALDTVRVAYDLNLPIFGSCWGHQLIARALGGKVIHDVDRAEMGCHHVELTEAGQEDELFKDFPTSFMANMGHNDRVSVLPENGIELAFNQTQPNEAFRIRNKPIYGTQFHSELDAHRERERLIRYRAFYAEQLHTEELFQQIMHGLQETTDVDHLLSNFITKFVTPRR
jgi:GMP synthase (glutamine-hydrolysing)